MQYRRSLLFCLIVILTLCVTFSVGAEESSPIITVGVDDSTPSVVQAEEKFTVNVTLLNSADLELFTFKLDYDAENLTFVGYEIGNVFYTQNNEWADTECQEIATGKIRYQYLGTPSEAGNGILISFTFQAKTALNPRQSFMIDSNQVGAQLPGGAMIDGSSMGIVGNPPADENGDIVIHTCIYSDVEEVAATCEANAYTKYTCECGDFYVDEQADTALGHNYGAWVSNGDGTHTKVCANDATHTVTDYCSGGKATCEDKPICVDCNTEYGKAKGHFFYEPETCTSPRLCQECNKSLAPTEHFDVEIIPAVEPTYKTEGSTEGKKCSVCGEILEAPEVIAKKSATWIWVTVSVSAAVVVLGAAAVVFFVLKKKGSKK